MSNNITLVNEKNETYLLNATYIPYLKTISNMLDGTDNEQEMIPVHMMDISVMPLLEKFCELCNAQKFLNEDFTPGNEWTMDFLCEYSDKFNDIVQASNFFEFRELYDSCKAYFKMIITTMSADDIREKFKLEDDLTSEEKRKVYSIGLYTLKIK